MKVEVHLYSQSTPITYSDVRNAYTKDGLYCIMDTNTGTVEKFPIMHIFRIKEMPC